jgi:hypothetical protein
VRIVNVSIDFCGELYTVEPGGTAIVGRDADISVDDNPYLHRRFLEVSHHDAMVWLANLGTQLSATVAADSGLLQAWLRPGARVPLVFARTVVWFTAGPTTYEFDVLIDEPPFFAVSEPEFDSGDTTIGRIAFTPDQKLLMLAVAESILRRGDRGAGTIPSSADAAARLGWTQTRFNRKLDNVCQKLTKAGVRGLLGTTGRVAASRKARLVEYAVSARLVTADDLPLLDAERLPAEQAT